jgi:glycosyltransferase involved in cell wall biosynthesis
MHVLLIAHYFPPDGGAGSQRPASLAQHLPTLGAEVTVVARDVEDSTRGMYDPADSTLVARTGSATIRRARKRGDDSWTQALAREAREAIVERRPDVILVTLSPFEHADAGLALSEEFGIPLVLDLRDPWALDGWHTYRHHFDWRRARDTMRAALEAADGVVMNVPEAAVVAARLAPRHGKHPYGVVTNGWEEADFPASADVPKGSKFRIRFAGGFCCRFMRDRSLLRSIRALLRGRGESIDERGRSPLFLLQAIQSLRDDPMLSDIGNDFVLEIAGAVEPETKQIIEETESGAIVRQLGYLPHDESVRFIAQADALLLPMHGLPPKARARMAPGKLYEYFGTGRPILGLCPAGDARDWIARDPRSRVADPVDFEEIAAKLCEMHAMWRRGEYVHSRRTAWAAEFTRRTQAERMLAYLSSVIDSGARPLRRPASRTARTA